MYDYRRHGCRSESGQVTLYLQPGQGWIPVFWSFPHSVVFRVSETGQLHCIYGWMLVHWFFPHSVVFSGSRNRSVTLYLQPGEGWMLVRWYFPLLYSVRNHNSQDGRLTPSGSSSVKSLTGVPKDVSLRWLYLHWQSQLIIIWAKSSQGWNASLVVKKVHWSCRRLQFNS